MKSWCFVIALLLATAMASRPSLAAGAGAHEDSRRDGGSIPAVVARELRGLAARIGSMFRSAGAGGWRAANANTTATAETKNLRAVASRRRGRPSSSSSRKSSGRGRGRSRSRAGCVTAAMCRTKRVICAKRCYAYGASASVNHVPSRCVVKCRKCVPTC